MPLRARRLDRALRRGCSRDLPLSAAHADDPFYKGKRLTLLINFAAGGPSDIEGRLLAKHIVKHLDGAPSIIVQNKDGAGGLVGAAYIGEVGPKDGTMFGYVTAVAWPYVIDPAAFRVDFKSYEFIGSQPGNAVYYVRADAEPGMKDEHRRLQGQGPGRRRSLGRFLEGPADPPAARHARPAAPLRHRLPQQHRGAARAAAQRDQFLLGDDARLFQRGRAEHGEDRAGGPDLVRRQLRRQCLQRAEGDGRLRRAGVPRILSQGEGRARRPVSCGTSIAPILRSTRRCCA